MECAHGCIFDGHSLMGDCRLPWATNCALNVKAIKEGRKECDMPCVKTGQFDAGCRCEE